MLFYSAPSSDFNFTEFIENVHISSLQITPKEKRQWLFLVIYSLRLKILQVVCLGLNPTVRTSAAAIYKDKTL
jgi:hypothetical protein